MYPQDEIDRNSFGSGDNNNTSTSIGTSTGAATAVIVIALIIIIFIGIVIIIRGVLGPVLAMMRLCWGCGGRVWWCVCVCGRVRGSGLAWGTGAGPRPK